MLAKTKINLSERLKLRQSSLVSSTVIDYPQHSSIWRYTSVVLTVIPFVAAPIDYILENVKLDSGFSKKVRLALDNFMTIILFAYVPARLSLIAQALALLREQPPAAFVAVDWTKYIPHLFN